MSKERKETPQDRYLKDNLRTFRVPCIIKTEGDIIDWLESKPNKAGYIKSLIRADIAAHKQKNQ